MVVSPVTSPFAQQHSTSSHSLRRSLEIGGVVVVYFAAARLGLSLASINANVSPIWPPTGLAIAAVILFGFRIWPAILTGAFLANFFTPVSLPVTGAIAVGNTLEAVCAVWFLRWFGFHRALNTAKDVFVLVAAALTCSTLSATIGTFSVYFGGFAAWETVDTLWWTWWLGDSIGAMIVTPLLLVWSRGSGAWSSKRYIEATIIFVLVGISTAATFSATAPMIPVRLYPIIRLTVPFFLWAAFRLGQRGITVASVIVSIVAIWGTSKGLGVFAGRSTNESLILLQIFLGSNSVMFLFLAATVEERRSVAQTMRKGQRLLAANLAVTRILAESPALNVATNRILETIGTMLDWQVGDMWTPDEDGKALQCFSIWHSYDVTDARIESFKEANRVQSFLPGVGLPGLAWSSLKPVWIQDVATDPIPPRAPFVLAAGLRSAFAFPIVGGDRFLGVMEFFSSEVRKTDEALLTMFSSVGNQIGQFVERKRAEEERELLLKREHSARSEAELANRTKDEFLAMVSHELRTPLNAIVGWSGMVRRGSLDKDQEQHAIEIIERNAKAQTQLIEDILDVSRIVSGKLRLDLRPTQLQPIVTAAIDSIRPLATSKSIRLTTELDRHAGPVSGDPDRLQQIIWNLLSNAVKFTPVEGQIEVRLVNGNENIEIIVRDTGQGIAPDVLPHIFDRFRQADSSKTRRHGGLGLGLAIVNHLVLLHGGTASAHSEGQGKGSEFRIVLPCITPTSGQLLRREAQRGVLSPSDRLCCVSILVVDDDVDSRDMLEIALRSQGADVVTAGSVREALAVLDRKDWRAGLLLSDLGMPEQDGYDLIRILRTRSFEEGGKLPAIALTGYAGREEGEKTLKEGFDAHLSKPVNWSELLKTIALLTQNGQ